MGLGLEFQPPVAAMRQLLASLRLTEYRSAEGDGDGVFEFEDVSRALAKHVLLEHHNVSEDALESSSSRERAEKVKQAKRTKMARMARPRSRKIVSRTKSRPGRSDTLQPPTEHLDRAGVVRSHGTDDAAKTATERSEALVHEASTILQRQQDALQRHMEEECLKLAATV